MRTAVAALGVIGAFIVLLGVIGLLEGHAAGFIGILAGALLFALASRLDD